MIEESKIKEKDGCKPCAPVICSTAISLKWKCPICGDVCIDPNDFRTTLCNNGHEAFLGHDQGNGWQKAYLP